MSDTFGELFAQYQVKMGIKNNKDLCAEISRILETIPAEKQEKLLKGFIEDGGHTLRKLMISLAQNHADITVLAKQIEVFNELPVAAPASIDPSAQVPEANPDPKASLPKAKSEKAAPNSNGIVSPSTPVVFKPEAPGTTSNSQPSVAEKPADEDGGGDDVEEDVVTPAPKPQAPRVVRTPNAPVFVQQHVDPPSFGDLFKNPRKAFEKWNRNRQLKAEQKTGQSTGPSRMKSDVSGAKIALYALLVAVVAGIIWIVANANPQGLSSGSVESQQVIEEAPPVDPNNVPLDVEGSVNNRGFVGELQKFIYALSFLTFLSVLGDRLYGRQFTDIIVYLIVTYSSIFLVLPPEVGAFTSVVVLLLLVGWITTASVQGEGKDFTIMVGWLLNTATIGGLVFTQIAVISNIFQKMTVGRVMAVVDLGYYFDTASLGLIAFSFVVYVFAFLALVVAIFEAVRRSEEGTMPLAPLICALLGILFYFLPLHVLSLAPWLSASIGMLVSVAAAGMAISPTGRQFVPREWANKSPYDGAVLYLAIMTVLVIVFGHAGWLIGY